MPPEYLDYAATTPLADGVLDAMMPYLCDKFGNAGSRTHIYGVEANAAVEKARAQVAAVVDTDPSDVVFTSGATEANNLATLGLAAYGEETGRKHIVSTTIEHKAILEPLARMEKMGFEVDLCPVGLSGAVDAEQLLSLVREDTLLVTVMHANNETGIIQPVDEIARCLPDPVYLHVDAAQTFTKLLDPLTNARFDLVSLSAHKFGGPKGVGALVVRRRNRRRVSLRGLLVGGGQERGLSAGTQAVHQIVGIGEASELSSQMQPVWSEEALTVRQQFLHAFEPLQPIVVGSGSSLPSTICVAFDGADAEAVMIALADLVAISNGSACTSDKYEASHVLKAMGCEESVLFGATRWSWGLGSYVDFHSVASCLRSHLLS